MYEVEVKVRTAHHPVRERLDVIDASSAGTVVQEDTYYDAPDRDFAETDEALRIRRETDDEGERTVKLTYKGPLVEATSKTRAEAETTVADDEALATILDALGFDPAATVRKERERYLVDGYTVTLDDVDGLGQFVECETTAPESDIKSAREGVYDLLNCLELDPDEQVRTSYLGLLLADADD